MFKKKFFMTMLSLVLTSMLVLTSCAGSSTDKGPEKGGNEIKKLKIAMVANASIADGGWTSACYQAMTAAAERNGFETAYSENVAQSDYVSMFKQYADLGYDLIFAPGGEYTDSVKELAPQYPNTGFILLNGNIEGSANVANVILI